MVHTAYATRGGADKWFDHRLAELAKLRQPWRNESAADLRHRDRRCDRVCGGLADDPGRAARARRLVDLRPLLPRLPRRCGRWPRPGGTVHLGTAARIRD